MTTPSCRIRRIHSVRPSHCARTDNDTDSNASGYKPTRIGRSVQWGCALKGERKHQQQQQQNPRKQLHTRSLSRGLSFVYDSLICFRADCASSDLNHQFRLSWRHNKRLLYVCLTQLHFTSTDRESLNEMSLSRTNLRSMDWSTRTHAQKNT